MNDKDKIEPIESNIKTSGIVVPTRVSSVAPAPTTEPVDPDWDAEFEPEAKIPVVPKDEYCGAYARPFQECAIRDFSWMKRPVSSLSESTEENQYTIRPGDTLWSVLRQNGYQAQEINAKQLVEKVARRNGLTDPNRLIPGSRIRLPENQKIA